MTTTSNPTVRPSVVDRPATRGLSVLVAADRTLDAEVLALTLETLGCEVAAAPLGQAAVDLAYLAQPDAVVLVTGKGGWEAVPAAVADRAGWRKPFVVALTAPGTGTATPPGVHVAVERPVSPELLAGLVRRFRELL